jgi:hypothetical protein
MIYLVLTDPAVTGVMDHLPTQPYIIIEELTILELTRWLVMVGSVEVVEQVATLVPTLELEDMVW